MKQMVVCVKKRCVACGACQNVCPRNAIQIEAGIKAIVDKNRCVGCGKCIFACPAGVLEKVEREEDEEN